jgi:hypothetical protein
MILTSHRHLVFPREPPRVPWYANLFRFGEPAGAAPLIVYVGGATTREKYLARSAPAPEHPVMREAAKVIAASAGRLRLRALNLLVCPCPLETGGQGPEAFVDHLDHEVEPQLTGAPVAVGLVGYSAGAEHATHAAIIGGARALAVFGGTGVVQTARQLRKVVDAGAREGRRLAIALFRNGGDETPEPAVVARSLRAFDVHPFPAAPGDHEFRSYAANGTVAAAFRFVVERVAEAA